MMLTSQRVESRIVCRYKSIRFVWVSLNGDDWLIKCQLSIDQTNRYRVIDWLSEWVSLARGCLIAWMRFALTLTHTHWHWGMHSDASTKVAMLKSRIRERQWASDWPCEWQVEQSLLVLTRAYGCCSWVIERFQFRVCVCWCFSVSLCEWESMPILDEWLVTERERSSDGDWIMSGNITLSRAQRARVRRATLPSWDRCP